MLSSCFESVYFFKRLTQVYSQLCSLSDDPIQLLRGLPDLSRLGDLGRQYPSDFFDRLLGPIDGCLDDAIEPSRSSRVSAAFLKPALRNYLKTRFCSLP